MLDIQSLKQSNALTKSGLWEKPRQFWAHKELHPPPNAIYHLLLISCLARLEQTILIIKQIIEAFKTNQSIGVNLCKIWFFFQMLLVIWRKIGSVIAKHLLGIRENSIPISHFKFLVEAKNVRLSTFWNGSHAISLYWPYALLCKFTLSPCERSE